MSQKIKTLEVQIWIIYLCLFPKVNSIMIKTLQRRSLTQSSRFASSQSSDKRHLNVEQYYWALVGSYSLYRDEICCLYVVW